MILKKHKKKLKPIVNRSKKNPIISPTPHNDWETWQTFNPGAILLKGKVHLIYRAVGSDGISRLGYAASKNGLNIYEKLPRPAYEQKMKERKFNIYSYFSGGSWGGAEDPRLVRVGKEDVVYMMYNAFDDGLRVALTSIKINDFLNKKWKWRQPIFISPPGQAHKNWLLFPEKIHGKYAIINSISPRIQITYLDNLEFKDKPYIESFHGGGPRKNVWDKWVRGVGAPPIKTKYGWLIFYHAMDDDWSKYKVGTMLLDLKDPTKILYRSKKPILEPKTFYENNGFKGGVVYVSGAVMKNRKLFIYYGSADTCVCVASVDLNEFLKNLKKDIEPKLKFKK